MLGVDIEPTLVEHMDKRIAAAKLTNARAVLSKPDHPALPAASQDRVLIVDVWHHIEARAAYAKALVESLKPGGQIAIVDFTLEATMGPPAALRLAPEAIIADFAGLGVTGAAVAETLPHQYVVIIKKP